MGLFVIRNSPDSSFVTGLVTDVIECKPEGVQVQDTHHLRGAVLNGIMASP